jgi:alpha-N-acetylglucosaminidase
MAPELRFIALFLLFAATAYGLQRPSAVGDPLHAIEGLVARILGEKYVSQIVYEVIQPDPFTGHDIFEIDYEETAKKPVLRGNNGVALASALNFYLKYDCDCSISWGREGSGDQLNLPQPLPRPGFLRMVSPVKHRYYLNVCTVSYSLAWWNFTRWEREIDWMAMNGLNLILSFTGQEYVWQKFYSSLGINETAIETFFSGPAFLTWQRMGNLRRWGGPLDDGWIQSQADMQKQIMARIREFGMINVLPGFAGHVPAELKDLFPNAHFTRNSGWSGFDSTYSDDYLLQPNDPLFMELGILYYRMLIDEFGTDHVYNCDTYNEMNPSSTNLTYLADVNKAIFQTMSFVDEDAIFLMQGWLFHSGWSFCLSSMYTYISITL